MKLISLHIENFGKLKDFDFVFANGINQIYQKNGFGKTTFTRFLKAMFYGMPKKGNLKSYAAERSRYAPWQGGVYGGSVVFEIKEKTYRLTRTFGKTPDGDTFELVDMATSLKTNDYDQNIGWQLFGVGAETFEITAFLPQEGAPLSVNDELRANLSGANKFDHDLSSMSQAMKTLGSKAAFYRGQIPKQAEIDGLKTAQIHLEGQSERLRSQLEQKKKDVIEIEILRKQKEEAVKQINSLKKQNSEAEKEKLLLEGKLQSQKELVDTLTKQKTNILEQQNVMLRMRKLGKGSMPLYWGFGCSLTLSGILVALAIILKLYPVVFYLFSTLFAVVGIVFLVVALVKNNTKLQEQKVDFGADSLKIIEQQLENAQEALLEIQKTYQTAITKMRPISPEEELAAQEGVELEKKYAVYGVEIQSLQRELESIEEKISKCIEDYDELLLRKSIYSRKLDLIEKTKAFMEEAKTNVSSRFVAPLQEGFNKFFHAVEEEKQGAIIMDANLDVNEMSSGGMKEFEYLSQGYKDVIAICKRLALVEQIFVKTSPFIILDDPLVNLDDKKTELIKKVLEKFGEKYQVIYLCAHSRCKIQ